MKYHRSKTVRRSLGGFLWAISLQYLLSQLYVAHAWSRQNGYSWLHNTISDLGNTHCGLYGGHRVCSPHHDLMNLSFVVLGICMMLGGLLLNTSFGAAFASKLSLVCIAIAGLGTLLVGLFPENTVSALHVSGAALAFIFGNVGMILFGYVATPGRLIRFYSAFSGLIGLIGLSLFFSGNYLGLGIGGMERITAYPLTVWLIVIGVYCVLSKQKNLTVH